eukprot:3815755-Lingulodinium_polyedra.AAC.1
MAIQCACSLPRRCRALSSIHGTPAAPRAARLQRASATRAAVADARDCARAVAQECVAQAYR